MNKTTFLGDKPINRIGYGAMQLAGPDGTAAQPGGGSCGPALRHRAWRRPHRHLAVLRTGHGQRPDRDTLEPYPEDLKLVSKVGARRDEAGAWLPAQSPAELRERVEAN
jgi:hypothetical protein